MSKEAKDKIFSFFQAMKLIAELDGMMLIQASISVPVSRKQILTCTIFDAHMDKCKCKSCEDLVATVKKQISRRGKFGEKVEQKIDGKMPTEVTQ